MEKVEKIGVEAADTLSHPGTILAQLSRYLGILSVVTMLVSVNIEVFGRTLFDYSTIWVTEVSTYLIVAITFLGAAYVASKNAHVSVDLVPARLSPALRKNVMVATNWMAVFVCIVVLWKTTAFFLESFQNASRSWSLLNTPLWIPQSTICIGMFFLVLFLVFKIKTESNQNSAATTLAIFPILAAILFSVVDGLGQMPGAMGSISGIYIIAGLVVASCFLVSGPNTIMILMALVLPLIVLFLLSDSSDLTLKAAVLIGALFFLLLAGLPVVFTLFFIGIVTMWFWLPPISLTYIGERAWGAVNTFELTAIPMFVLMGAILVRSNASGEMFTAARKGLGRVAGGLAHASIAASGIFAAVSGSSLATAATMGRVAGPEMMKEGYRPELAFGVLAAGGTLGILIPPSIAMIIYGPLAGVPVTDLFLAGILPGLLMIAAFVLVVVLWVTIDPKAAPEGKAFSWIDKLYSLKGVAPFLALMAMVLGSLYLGIATPTEAGAVGVFGALLISLLRRTLSLKEFLAAVEDAALATSMLLMIAVGAAIMSFGVDYLSMPQQLVLFVQSLGLPDLGLFIAIVILYLILGMFVEPISMVLMTLPVILPVIIAAGWDPLWFGVILVMLVEIGLITPPVGMIIYVLAGVTEGEVSIGQISIGTIPFVGAFLAMVFVFFALPELITIIPDMTK
ncbi:TRAP transporter large permease subunit [Sneathiella marina]|uniref:TRAP transporter large permease subunit n=1 Tax=Sneathiella marina TaxID=2950108 RepID=A0ABY4WAX7_9PROT|nr:TRAP transporter large permease subunit [Sneathiella marina]USG62419.1 TRAP transporter large permease subunit [Sneathiella marina]